MPFVGVASSDMQFMPASMNIYQPLSPLYMFQLNGQTCISVINFLRSQLKVEDNYKIDLGEIVGSVWFRFVWLRIGTSGKPS
jgi:hypothetical protein